MHNNMTGGQHQGRAGISCGLNYQTFGGLVVISDTTYDDVCLFFSIFLFFLGPLYSHEPERKSDGYGPDFIGLTQAKKKEKKTQANLPSVAVLALGGLGPQALGEPADLEQLKVVGADRELRRLDRQRHDIRDLCRAACRELGTSADLFFLTI